MKVVASTTERLQQLLINFDISQADLCRKTEIPKSSLSRYLSGKRELGLDQAKAIAKAYNINPAWLMGFDVPMSASKPYMLSKNEKGIILDINTEIKDMPDEMLQHLLNYIKLIKRPTENDNPNTNAG